MNSFFKQKRKIKYINSLKQQNISNNIKNNLNTITSIYSIPQSKDIVLRKFNILFNNKTYLAFGVFIDGLVNANEINEAIMKPLLYHTINSSSPLDYCIEYEILADCNLTKENNFANILSNINSGCIAIFIDTLNIAYICDVKKYEHREISTPINEVSIKGPQISFVENIRSNTAILRKILNDEDLVFETIEVGQRSRTQCMIGYINSIANPNLVNKIKNRVSNVSIDYLLDSGQLANLIEDHPLSIIPQFLNTERPDKVASHLSEGRICIIVNNSPNVLIAPTTFWDLFHSPEESYIKFQYANFIRFIRFLAYFCSLFLPGIYIALTNFHVELLPTDLLFSIAAIKETIPFPLVVEIIIMEVSLELIREAGSRMPNSIGSSLGIVGAVLLGQASVDANLVSPILILVVAITAISSFATPNYSLAFSFRILRFVYIILASIFGFFGLFCGFIIQFIYICNIYSFGIPYFIDYDKYSNPVYTDLITIMPNWLSRFRPPFLHQLDNTKNPPISMKLKKKGT